MQIAFRGEYHQTHLPFDSRREVLWQALWKYFFCRYIQPDDCVLELGAGYGHFINNVRARCRIAIDAWPGFTQHLAEDVHARVGDVTDLSFLEDDSVNFAFASNLFEHLTHADFALVLVQLRRVLKENGILALLQPNYRYAYREYFDDYTHITIYSDESLCDFLWANGYRIEHCVPRFMPLTVKSRIKVWAPLIWMYLHSPIKPFGKQMLVFARPRRS
jgi:ubiquinone/menaquinone biosynthesis C-methylase UbiE